MDSEELTSREELNDAKINGAEQVRLPRIPEPTFAQAIANAWKSVQRFVTSGAIKKTDFNTTLKSEVEAIEKVNKRGGVDFSRIQIGRVLDARDAGKRIEFDTLSPYWFLYKDIEGEVSEDDLTKEDRIGLILTKTFRDIFPNGTMVSFWDEYHTSKQDDPKSTDTRKFNPDQLEIADIDDDNRSKFQRDLVNLMKKNGSIRELDTEGKEYLTIPESSKVAAAEELVTRLEEIGLIKREGERISLVNPDPSDPRYSKITLKTVNGKWLCHTLDAASYLKEENKDITHIVVLENGYKEQQDKVWEMLHLLGIPVTNYHNIFYDGNEDPQKIADTIKKEFEIVAGN